MVIINTSRDLKHSPLPDPELSPRDFDSDFPRGDEKHHLHPPRVFRTLDSSWGDLDDTGPEER